METSPIEQRLLNDYQRDFPLVPRPFARIAADLGADEGDVIERFAALQDAGKIVRVGAVVRPHAVGYSTLAAVAADPAELDRVAASISAFPEVNHCYEREHAINVWFVVTARDEKAVSDVLSAIERATGLAVLDLPLIEAYHIDLAFAL